MQEILLVFFTLLAVVCAVIAILKKFNSRFAFIALGLIFMLIATWIKGTSVLGEDTTGSLILDVFDVVRVKLKDTAGGIGATVMMGGAYVLFMNHIKASNVLANGAARLLKNFKLPYVLLSIVFIFGSVLKLFITSQVALGMLLMITLYPILIRLGVSKLSCVSAIIMCGFLDEGVNDSSAIFTSGVMEMTPFDYFITYEGRVGLITVLVMAVFLPLYFKKRDLKEFGGLVIDDSSAVTKEADKRPGIYGILPIVPLALIIIFNFIPSVKMDVITANVIGFTVAFIFELIRRRHEVSAVSNMMTDVGLFMADYFNKVVAMIISAYIFSEGVKQLQYCSGENGGNPGRRPSGYLTALRLDFPDRSSDRKRKRALLRLWAFGASASPDAGIDTPEYGGSHAPCRKRRKNPIPLLRRCHRHPGPCRS